MPMTPEEMEEKLSKLTEGVSSLVENQTQFQKNLQQALRDQQQTLNESLSSTLQSVVQQVGGDKSSGDSDGSANPPTYDDADLESMSRRQFMDLLSQQFGQTLDKKLGEVRDELNTTRHESHRERITRQVQDLQKEKPDFDKWRDEMSILVKKNPSLGPREAYILARADNPEKAKEIDAELEKESSNDGGNGRDSSSQKKTGNQKEGGNFGGMRPSSGERSEENNEMSNEDSFEAAWDAVFGDDAQQILAAE